MSQLIMTLFYNSDRYFAVHSIFTYTLSLADIASPIYGLYTAFWCSICGVLWKWLTDILFESLIICLPGLLKFSFT